jgi:hypothetical protein
LFFLQDLAGVQYHFMLEFASIYFIACRVPDFIFSFPCVPSCSKLYMLLSWLCFIGLFFFLPSLHFHHNLCCASIVKSFVELFWASFPLDSCFVEIATCLLYSAAVCKSLWAGRVIVDFFLLFFHVFMVYFFFLFDWLQET